LRRHFGFRPCQIAPTAVPAWSAILALALALVLVLVLGGASVATRSSGQRHR
jgi:hypothetical protein